MELDERAKVLIEKAEGAGYPQISLASIRRSQDEDLFAELADQAERRLVATGTGHIGGAGFFLGSVDFIVERGGRRFYVLEVNGGSSRGLSLVGLRGWRCLLYGCLEAFDFLPERLAQRDHASLADGEEQVPQGELGILLVGADVPGLGIVNQLSKELLFDIRSSVLNPDLSLFFRVPRPQRAIATDQSRVRF